MALKLKKLDYFKGRKGPLLLIIMDGIGIGIPGDHNAVYLAKTPNLDRLFASRLFCTLKAHGISVGLPSDEDMGNSEVGHNALGAGRVFAQGALLVNRAIETGEIFSTQMWQDISERAKAGGTIHFIGLLSDGNVHSHINQLYRLVEKCAESGFGSVRIHTLLDGRDVEEKSALRYVEPTEELLLKISVSRGMDYRVASGGGRMRVTMDRYGADWEIVRRGWEAHVLGKGRKFSSASEAIKTLYAEDSAVTDQFLDAFVIADNTGSPVGKILDGDVVINFNFRGDRAIEISRAFTEKDFPFFDRGPLPNVLYAGMMEYDGDTHMPPRFLVVPPAIDRTVSEYLCAEGVRSFAIAETQKFGHVTYFWNGNRSGYIDESLETYVEVPSDRVRFETTPAMKAFEVKAATVEMLLSGSYQFGRVNFANGDMVGHTGVMAAAIAAVEVVDSCVGELLAVIERLGGIAVVTADHGNADEMTTKDKKGNVSVKTAHTLNPVPFAVYDPEYMGEYEMAPPDKMGLSNVAATILNLMGYERPDEYDPSLIRGKGED